MSRRRYIVSFANGPAERVAAMRSELRNLLPGYEHREAEGKNWLEWISRFPPFSIAHTAGLIGEDCDMGIFRQALLLAPGRMLAYNRDGDRYHVHPARPLTSLLFLSGHPVHRIHLRPWRDETTHYPQIQQIQGRAATASKSIAILSPYLPWPLSHGGAVRIFNLIACSAGRFNIQLFAFTEKEGVPDLGPLKDHCTGITLVRKPDFRRVAWASLLPSEVLEYETPAMREALQSATYDLLQTEFTQLAGYGGDILVEHDVSMDLAAQQHARTHTLTSAWNLTRWKRFETKALKRFSKIVVMSGKDLELIGLRNAQVVPNGVDLERYQPSAEQPGTKLLFIGSFRHYPNALAYRFLAEEFWPRLRALLPDAELEVVAGPDPEIYYPFGAIPKVDGIQLCGFVSDVRPCYHRCNLVLIPTPLSAGTNIKAIEAMAMQRAILSTPSGVNGLSLKHGSSVWIAEGADAFAHEACHLLHSPELRKEISTTARQIAETHFDWREIAKLQEKLWDAT